jgi:hypothetical protein
MLILALSLPHSSQASQPKSPFGHIAVYVIYGSSTPRSPIADVEVRVFGTAMSGKTDSSGTCMLDSVPAGEQVVMLSYGDASQQALLVEVTPGETAQTGTTMYPPPPKFLVGTVRDSLTRKAIAGASVSLEGAGLWAGFGPFSSTTDSSGRYSIAVESVPLFNPPMWFRAAARHPGYVRTAEIFEGSEDVMSRAPDSSRIDFALLDTNRAALVGRVTLGASGTPLYDADVIAPELAWTALPYASQTGTDGRYELLLGPGQYPIVVGCEGFRSQLCSLVVAPGSPTHRDFKLWPDSSGVNGLGHLSVAVAAGPAWHPPEVVSRIRARLGTAYAKWSPRGDR